MPTAAVHVKGLRETLRALEGLGVDVDELKDVMSAIAASAAKVMSRYTPVDSGALKGTIRGNRAKSKAVVTVGRGKVNNYAGPINYGWPARHIDAANFIAKTDVEFGPHVERMLNEGIGELVRRHGLN
jgi:hypothetical protein